MEFDSVTAERAAANEDPSTTATMNQVVLKAILNGIRLYFM
jgi:hypothetical protein